MTQVLTQKGSNAHLAVSQIGTVSCRVFFYSWPPFLIGLLVSHVSVQWPWSVGKRRMHCGDHCNGLPESQIDFSVESLALWWWSGEHHALFMGVFSSAKVANGTPLIPLPGSRVKDLRHITPLHILLFCQGEQLTAQIWILIHLLH